ncbi:hypothetical protein F4778DRAFT_489961 [Xylariomycetidae sp. FL2044]|nr:hypothetical protein F4778DRAFT_489961 [Xylariomycetidae sp. FL2044]
MSLNTITPTSGIDLLVTRGMEHFREKATSPDPETGLMSPLSGFFTPRPSSRTSRRSRARSGDYSCLSPQFLDDDDDDQDESRGAATAPPKILELPNELQYEIFAYLGLGDMERLRRTCRHYERLLNRPFIRAHFDGDDARLASQLTSHCQTCLAEPGRHSLLILRPPSAKCFGCAVRERELRVGSRVALASGGGGGGRRTNTVATRPEAGAWVCRWCGWPVNGAPSWANEQFHINCYDRYYRVLWIFLCLGFAQFAVGVVAATLSLRYFRDDLLVFPPAVVTFVLLWVCMGFLMFRGNRIRTYHWVGMVELVILGLWIPPIYSLSTIMTGGLVENSAIAALTFFAFNVVFRLLNCVGNIVLAVEYDMTKHYVPEQTLRRRLLNALMAGLIYWTYPQCVEQRYPPDFN